MRGGHQSVGNTKVREALIFCGHQNALVPWRLLVCQQAKILHKLLVYDRYNIFFWSYILFSPYADRPISDRIEFYKWLILETRHLISYLGLLSDKKYEKFLHLVW